MNIGGVRLGGYLAGGRLVTQAQYNLAGRSNTPAAIENGETSVFSTEGLDAGDVRSVVARRFMRMLQSHDRTRLELLGAHLGQPRQ
jgi:hypothetical protein